MTGKPLIDYIIAGLNILVLAGSAFFVHQATNFEPTIDPSLELEKFNKEAITITKGHAYALPKLTINLYSQKTRLHYLDTVVELILMKDEYKGEIEDEQKGHKHLIISTIIETVSALRPQEISTVSGKILLAEKIKENVNLKVGKQIVQKVLFTRFVVQ